MSIAVEGLTHIYEPDSPWRIPALKDVSFNVPAGDAVAIIGPTGSGKSTLVQLMAGLIRPSQGRVLIENQNIWAGGVARRELRLRVGLVFQYPEHQLFESTVRNDVAFGPRNLGLDPAVVDERVNEAIVQVGLDCSVLDRSPFDLSGGQMRRVAIAGVLAMKPRVLIVDEPTAGLDPRGRVQLLGLLHELRRNSGLTLIMISHNMDDVAQVADRVAVLNHGAVVLDGPIRPVFSQVERLRGLGLDVPVTTGLASRLADRGWPVPRDIFTAHEIADAITGALSGQGEQGAGPPA